MKEGKVKYYRFNNMWFRILKFAMWSKQKWLFKLVHQKPMGTIYYQFSDGKIIRNTMYVRKGGTIS